jgi:hypothetical protein
VTFYQEQVVIMREELERCVQTEQRGRLAAQELLIGSSQRDRRARLE